MKRLTCTRRARPWLGTLVEIAAEHDDADERERAIEAAFAAIARVQARMSAHDPDSDVGRINRAAIGAAVPVDADTWFVLSSASALQRDSAGLFDCRVSASPTLTRADLLLPAPGVVVKTGPLRVDLGGIAKGYAVDVAVAALRGAGMRAGCVNAGGDLRVFGPGAQRIHVRDPGAPTRLLPLVDLHDMALATSADYAGRMAQAGRLIDPRDASGQANVAGLSISVLAPSCMMADALTKVVALSGDAHHPLLAAHGASAHVLGRLDQLERSGRRETMAA